MSTPLSVVELGNARDAVAHLCNHFRDDIHSSELRLHCTIPTWTESTLDLHDLHTRQTAFVAFVRELCTELKGTGIAASYALLPAHSSRAVLCWGSGALWQSLRILEEQEALARDGILFIKERKLLVFGPG
uniref:Uncharacterized protein n=1 Tax=Mycena chlorophos TaxID=658473 RepID=A0ABQ0KZ38_MYCCL|nr:predicted protein [Mycena chlorophos]